jgi:hypothetical protein
MIVNGSHSIQRGPGRRRAEAMATRLADLDVDLTTRGRLSAGLSS